MTEPRWTPQLIQNTTLVNGQTVYGDVYIDTGQANVNVNDNVYSLDYTTTFTMQEGTFTFPSLDAVEGQEPGEKDVPIQLVNMRKTLIGVIPLINMGSSNPYTKITYSFPTNNYAISVVSFDRNYSINPQQSSTPDNSREENYDIELSKTLLEYSNALVINGVYNATNGFVYGQNEQTYQMEIKQAKYIENQVEIYNEKKILVPIKIIKAVSSLSIKEFSGVTRYTIPNADTNGIITREYLDASFELIFSDFATTTRKNVNVGTPDYDNIIYYLNLSDTRNFQFGNDNITITNNKISFKKVTILADGTYSPIPIKFLQEETAIYRRSTQRIGDSDGSMITIRLNIIKSTPTFVGQSPPTNTVSTATVYRLTDLNKMTTERSFIITPPVSNNSDPDATFIISSSDNSILKIDKTGTTYTAFINGPGVVTVTITQPSTTNFNTKSASFDVNIFNITPSIINCNYNLFYTNPYNRNFWTRFKPECRSSNLVNTNTNAPLSVTQVDEVYDMRRKAEILKYSKNVGGLTKSQKYAKASRGELMRKIGNEQNYISQTIGGITTLVCPPSTSNSRLSCGLTSACGVPGKERLLCLDPSINLYNYKRTYQYQAGLQVPTNIQATILTEPTNLRIKNFDNINNKVTLEWDAPDSNGGFPIVGYVITYSEDNNKWLPYKSVFPYKPATAEEARAATFNQISGEINGNTVIFERILNNVEIRANTIYYISVFSGNERGLSSVPATIIVKTSSVPSIISDFAFTKTSDERENLMVDLKWSDPLNNGTTIGSFNGPPIYQYNLYYRKVPALTGIKDIIDLSNVIIVPAGSQQRRFILRNLENQNKYDIKIEPVNSIGVGPESVIITARTLMKPSVPLNIVLTPKYGVLSNISPTTPINYFNIRWDKPDTGGNPITQYNVTVTEPAPSLKRTTISYAIVSTDSRTTFNYDIGILGQTLLIPGSYTVVMEAFNGYLTSNESLVSIVTLKSITQIPRIISIKGEYNKENVLLSADLTFSINDPWVDENKITTINVRGFTKTLYQTTTNNQGQSIVGTGQHTITIPQKASDGSTILNQSEEYTEITIQFVFSLTGEGTASQPTSIIL
jgi:hypothetical protein